MKTLNELFREVICLNEVGGDMNAVLRFSDPDGKSGRSGYSFGLTQMDTRHNAWAIKCLVDCGFTTNEIHGIVEQSIDVRPFAVRLIACKSIIEKYDEVQLGYCLDTVAKFNTAHGVDMTDVAAVLATGDVVNQYGSIGTGFATFMKGLGRPVVVNDVLAWRLQTKYGKEHPEDSKRRIGNVVKVCSEA